MACKNNFKWTPKKVEAVKTKLLDFFNDVELYHSESLMQSDRGNIGSIETMCDIVDIMFNDIDTNCDKD